MKFTYSALPLGLFLLLLFACKDSSTIKVAEKSIEFNKEGLLTISQSGKEKITSFDIEIADNPYERQTGLMYRNTLEVNQGMLFAFEQEAVLNFYMKNTPLALDLIFLNKELEIVHIHKNAIPNDPTGISSVKPAQYVFEIQAGLSDQYEIQEGDQITYQKLESK